MDELGYRFLLLLLTIALNAFLAGSEAALLAARRSRLRDLAAAGNVGAQAAIRLVDNPERLVSAVQVGLTLTSLGLGWVGGDTIFRLLQMLAVPLEPASLAVFRAVCAFLSFSVITFAHVLFGEMVPKAFAAEKADGLAVVVAPAMLIYYRLCGPFVLAIEKASAALSRLLSLRGSSPLGHSPEDLKLLVSTSRKEGHLCDFEEDAVKRVLDLHSVSAREIMVPRNAMVALPVEATLDEVLRALSEHQYSRLPVYQDKLENIIGVVHFKDLARVWDERKRAHERGRPTRTFRLRRVLRRAVVVPETKPLHHLLEDFRVYHTHLAMVVDEFGTISGLVTLEDVIEQVFGEIEDEHDERRLRPLTGAVAMELDGATNIRDLETQYSIEVPGDAGFETLAGFLLFQFGDIPKPGDSVDHGGRRFTVIHVERNRIVRVRVEKLVAV